MTEPVAQRPIAWVDLSGAPSLAAGSGRLGMCGLARAVTIDETDGVDMLVVLVDTSATFEEMPSRTRIVRHPIVDMGVPADDVAFGELVTSALEEVRAGHSVVVSCLAGYGRTGMTVACLLVDAGLSGDEAIELVRSTRPGAIETGEQLAYVRAFR